MVAFSADMEWTGQQQIFLSFQSVIFGLLLGILFDVFNGIGKTSRRSLRVWIDIIWGPISSVIVFFGALFLANGQLHPVFLFGAAVGMLLEHGTIGVWISKFVVCCCVFLSKISNTGLCIGRFTARLLGNFIARIRTIIKKLGKFRKNA